MGGIIDINTKPWENEPDHLQFLASGLLCHIRRASGTLHLNGYVSVPSTHPLYGMGYDRACVYFDLNVHGGLTFSKLTDNGRLWTFGFDCAHCDDYCPGFPTLAGYGTYKNIAYVKNEIHQLADQLSKITPFNFRFKIIKHYILEGISHVRFKFTTLPNYAAKIRTRFKRALSRILDR